MNRTFKTVLIALGSGVAILALAIGAFAYFMGMHLDEESKAAAQVYDQDVANGWDYAAIQARGDEELFKAAPKEKLEPFLALFRDRLGNLVSLGEVSGSSNCYFNITSMSVRTTAVYVLKAKFEKGDGTIQMNLIKRDDQWRMLGLHVDSPLLLDLNKPANGS
jgi:hypothetical protein